MMNGCHFFAFLVVVYHTAYAQEAVGDSCTLRNTGASGTCKLLSDCPAVEEGAKNGIRPTVCGFDPIDGAIVCCAANQQENNRESDSFVYLENPAVSSASSSSNSNLRKSEQKCEEYNNSTVRVTAVLPLIPDSVPVDVATVKCEFEGVPLIVGGTPASAGEFPFMAAVGVRENQDLQWKCGGTLISDQYVLTAAHCTAFLGGGAPNVVRLGDLDLQRTDDGSEHKDYEISKITAHPDYEYPLKYNDIALLKLRETVKFTNFIRPACLHHTTHISQRKAVATGYGKTDYLAVDINHKLLKVALNVYDNDNCNRTYKRSKNLPEGFKSTMLCAGELNGGRDTCQGDSGGPLLVIPDENNCKFYIIGVTSFGKYCGATNIPAVYSRVSEYVPWIESIVW